MRKSVQLSLVAALSVMAMSVAATAATKKVEEKPAEASALRTPEHIVQTVCSACHGVDGNAVITQNPKLASQHPDYLVKQLTEFKSGKRNNAVMTGMAAGLSDEEIQGLADYFSKQNIKLGKAKANGAGSQGEKIYRGGIAAMQVPACASCHGATGAGLPKQFPRLAGQNADYTLQQLKNFRTGERANAPMMMTITQRMTDADMAAVADYVQGLR